MSAHMNDGGLAFPLVERGPNGESSVSLGMSLRDYFIAHAPVEPQPWFSPVVSRQPVGPTFPHGANAQEANELDGLREGWLDVDDLTEPRIIAYAKARAEYEIAVRAWNGMVARERYVQWPAAWADAMLKARTE